MIKKFTLLMVALLLSVVGAKAKPVTTTLWKDTYTGNIAIEASKLQADATITVYMSWPGNGGTHIRAIYKKTNGDEIAFDEGVTDWNWQSNGTESYAFTIAQSNMDILNDNTQSQGELYIRSGNSDEMIITKITLTTTSSETATTNQLWTGTVSFGGWANKVNGIASTSGAKIGDIIQVTFSNATTSDNNIWICKSNTEEDIRDDVNTKWGQTSATSESGTLEFEIRDAVILEAVQSGIMLKGNNATVTDVSLLTYESSYDAVSIKVGSEGVATYSNGGKNVQISACDGLKAYYASAVAKGIVTLTELTGCIPANMGVIVKGSQGTYTVPVGSDGWPGEVTNYLKPTGDNAGKVYKSVYEGYTKQESWETDAQVTNIQTKYRYIFAKHNGDIGFYLLPTDYSEGGNPYHTLAAHKAYLETDNDLSADAQAVSMGSYRYMRLSFGGGGGTTAINTALKNPIVEDGLYYTLQGVAVKNPSKGIYILNGKKVFIK